MFDPYSLARTGLFTLDPEHAHDLTLRGVQMAARMRLPMPWPKPAAAPCTVMGIEFPNPVGLAAGLDKDGVAIEGFAALGFGFIEVGTVTRRPQPGNPLPRMFRIPAQSALINRMGFNNAGVEAMVSRLRGTTYHGVLGINIGRNKETDRANDDYRYCLGRVYPYASYVVVNLSSPNTPGLRDSQYGSALDELLDVLLEERAQCVERFRKRVPLLIKIAPDLALEDVDAIVDSLVSYGVDGVVATNTTVTRPGMDGLPVAKESGGLSGAPLAPLADAVLERVVQHAAGRLVVIGVGGVVDAVSAARKRELGADLVQVYTGLIYRGPGLVNEAVRGFSGARSVSAA